MPGNGTLPVVTAPPADVSPFVANPFGVSIGLVELLSSPQDDIPSEFLANAVVSRESVYSFEEYAIDEIEGIPQTVSINGQTIDWGESELARQGNLTLDFGIVRTYQLAGKPYEARKYTYLSFQCVYNEGGESKSCSFVIRLKHF